MTDEQQPSETGDEIISDVELEAASGGNGGAGGDGRLFDDEPPEGAGGNGGDGNSWGPRQVPE